MESPVGALSSTPPRDSKKAGYSVYCCSARRLAQTTARDLSPTRRRREATLSFTGVNSNTWRLSWGAISKPTPAQLAAAHPGQLQSSGGSSPSQGAGFQSPSYAWRSVELKRMGILQSKKATPKEKHPLNKDIKNENAGEAATDFNKCEANVLTGNLDNAANSGRDVGPPQLQTETSSGNEAVLTRMHPVPADYVPQNREQDTHKAAGISQNADPVKYFSSPASASPAVEPRHGMKQTVGELDVQRSDVLQQLRDTPEKSSPEQTKPAQHQKKTTAPVEAKNRNFTPSQQQRPAAAETTQVPPPTGSTVGTAADQVAARVLCKDFSCQAGGGELVQGVTKEHQHSKEAKTKAKINQLPGKKPGCVLSQVNEESTDSTCHAAQTATTKPAAAEVLAVKPTEPTNQQKPKETEITTVQESSQQKDCTAVEGNTTKKHNKPHQTAQSKKADNTNNGSSSSGIQKVHVEAEAAQVAGVEEMPTATPNKPPAADTSVKLKLKTELKVSPPKYAPAKSKKKCTHKAFNQTQPKKTRDVTVKEERHGKNRQVENQEPDHSPAGSLKHKAGAKGHWHPFTVNQSCPRKVCRQDGPETVLPPNTQNK
ncbi:hypothetical protein L3Q82_004893 [Scortum barcoo]|uniref:Uncharacterized protein n=1 Tax=Scortum barcoo TaxID=214431 RepID=A0ACB8VDN8_9TELE|nr:hypothetical protein L3Q82_004893 [Scortum barcoo]